MFFCLLGLFRPGACAAPGAGGIIYDMTSRQGEAAKDMQERGAYPPSPCNSICTLDDNHCCLGCKRTLEEITRWALMDADEQWAVVARLASRQ